MNMHANQYDPLAVVRRLKDLFMGAAYGRM